MPKTKREAIQKICRVLMLYKHKDYELFTLAMACGLYPCTQEAMLRISLRRKNPVFVQSVKKKVNSWKKKLDL